MTECSRCGNPLAGSQTACSMCGTFQVHPPPHGPPVAEPPQESADSFLGQLSEIQRKVGKRRFVRNMVIRGALGGAKMGAILGGGMLPIVALGALLELGRSEV